MPRRKNHQHQQPVFDDLPDFPDPADLNFDFHRDDLQPEPVQEPEPEPEREVKPRKQGRKQHKNARYQPPPAEELLPEPTEELALEDPAPSPRRQHTLLHQISLPSHSKSKPVNIREDLAATEKVSDQYTPPSDVGIPDDLYGRSPNSVAISSAGNTPPVEPGFSNRKSLKTRTPPVSPPQHSARPVSFGGTPLPRYARPPSAAYGSPPAPHLPQPHFYGGYDIDLGLPKPDENITKQDPLFTRFVSLPKLGNSIKQGIITGYNRTLQICSYDGTTVDEVGTLTDLPGTPADAELLSWTSRPDPFAALRPLLAVTFMHLEPAEGGNPQYRYTVSVYSLRYQRHVLDLLHTPSYTIHPSIPGQFHANDQPVNHICLKADGNYLAVSSGRSGELFVFSVLSHEEEPTFECLRKFWTTIQPREQPRGSSHTRPTISEATNSKLLQVKPDESVPILALSGRWLAICPPASTPPSAGFILGECIFTGRQAGLETLGAGNRPTVNCDVDSPDADTLLGRVARGVAQEMMKAGKWLGEQGAQAWQNYWKKEDVPTTPPFYNTYGNVPQTAQTSYGHFPPTHADTQAHTRDPDLVSVIDLKAMSESSARKSNAATPTATFQPPNGCSFLSFAPHGLMLLTASRKGDYQYVWDLLEMKHSRVLTPDLERDNVNVTPHVRQLARFDRLSGSVIVEVVWELPTLSRLAVVTKNKTIHLFDIPASALRWPPPRRPRKSRPTSAPPNAVPETSHDPAPAGGFFASAKSFAGRTQPILANLRGRTPSTSGGFSGIGQAGFGIAAATGARGSKAVATGLSKSLGAATETVSRIHHAGESRLHIKSEKDVVANRLIWIRRVSNWGLALLGENGVRYYQVRKSKPRDARQVEATVFDARRAVSIKLPVLGGRPSRDDVRNVVASYFHLPNVQGTDAGTVHPLSLAEIDTNAPFQPFHSDQRVTMSIFASSEHDPRSMKKSKKTKSSTTEPWVFGDEIAQLRLNINPSHSQNDEVADSVIHRKTTMSVGVGDEDHIVSTTRRKKIKRGVTAQDDDSTNPGEPTQEGFFEDDCDVLDFAADRV